MAMTDYAAAADGDDDDDEEERFVLSTCCGLGRAYEFTQTV